MISKRIKGRGAQVQLQNPFENNYLSQDIPEGVDDWTFGKLNTKIYLEHPKSILSKNNSPDIPFEYSINPYQGCEHGCVYCYARNSHTYWGFNAGQDFESRIIVKRNAATLLSQEFQKKSWKPKHVILSGNTDCYQPLERKWKITRKLLAVFRDHRNPVGIITKNALVCRDLDILEELASKDLIKVIFSITSLDEKLRSKMEPRTSSIKKKFEAIESLRNKGVPVSILIGPIIPGLNDHEIPGIIKASANAGAKDASYTLLRLNGQIDKIFLDWLELNFPDRFNKVVNQVKSLHQGKLNDSRWGKRMRGEGQWSETTKKVFEINKRKYMPGLQDFEFNLNIFRRNTNPGLFD